MISLYFLWLRLIHTLLTKKFYAKSCGKYLDLVGGKGNDGLVRVLASFKTFDPIMKIEAAILSQYRRLVVVWESSVHAMDHFYMTAVLRPLLINAYPPNLQVAIALDNAGIIYGF